MKLEFESDVEVAPGIFTLDAPTWNADDKEWRCLANVHGALCVIAVRVTVLMQGKKYGIVLADLAADAAGEGEQTDGR